MDESASPIHAPERKSLLKAALLLQRVGAHVRAIESLRKLLTAEPYNVIALRAIARSWQATGDFENARSALERARTTAPADMEICVEIADTYTKSDDHANAYRYIQKALDIDPNAPVAHQAMVQTLRRLGRPGDAVMHQQRSTAANAGRVHTIVSDSTEDPIRLLVLASDESASITIGRALRRNDFTLLVVYIESLNDNAILPEHDVFFSTLRFEARYRTKLQYLDELLTAKRIPVINRPSAVLATDPAIAAWRLEPIEHLRTAAITRIERATLLSAQGLDALQARQLWFPILMKPQRTAQARHELITSQDDLQAYLARNQATTFACLPFFDLRSADGRIRCYRIAMIGDQIYPLAFASAYHWRVDLTTTDEPSASTLAEEEHFFRETVDALGRSTLKTLRAITACIEIDVCVMDISIAEDGHVALLRLDAASDWQDPPEGEAFSLRRRASDRARQAIFELITDRSATKKSAESHINP